MQAIIGKSTALQVRNIAILVIPYGPFRVVFGIAVRG